MPNPSELQRMWEEEQIAHRSEQLKKMADSRKESQTMTYHQECAKLRELVHKIRDGYLCKSDKETVLGEIRVLEKKLGFDLGNYNSPDFAASII